MLTHRHTCNPKAVQLMARRLHSMLQDQLNQAGPLEPVKIGHVPVRIHGWGSSTPFISLPSNQVLPWNRRLTRTGTAQLKSLGFTKTAAAPQHWQIPLPPADVGESIRTCTEAIIAALIEAYSVEPVVLAHSLNLTVEQHHHGTVPATAPTRSPPRPDLHATPNRAGAAPPPLGRDSQLQRYSGAR